MPEVASGGCHCEEALQTSTQRMRQRPMALSTTLRQTARWQCELSASPGRSELMTYYSIASSNDTLGATQPPWLVSRLLGQHFCNWILGGVPSKQAIKLCAVLYPLGWIYLKCGLKDLAKQGNVTTTLNQVAGLISKSLSVSDIITEVHIRICEVAPPRLHGAHKRGGPHIDVIGRVEIAAY